jgi:hypothetical protein
MEVNMPDRYYDLRDDTPDEDDEPAPQGDAPVYDTPAYEQEIADDFDNTIIEDEVYEEYTGSERFAVAGLNDSLALELRLNELDRLISL